MIELNIMLNLLKLNNASHVLYWFHQNCKHGISFLLLLFSRHQTWDTYAENFELETFSHANMDFCYKSTFKSFSTFASPLHLVTLSFPFTIQLVQVHLIPSWIFFIHQDLQNDFNFFPSIYFFINLNLSFKMNVYCPSILHPPPWRCNICMLISISFFFKMIAQ